jgi:hypothetical protein
LGKRGPWTEKFDWLPDAALRWRPVSHASDQPADPRVVEQQLVGRVAGSVSLNDFPTDGRMYLFSSLRPDKSKDGALELTTAREGLFHGLLFALVLLGGVLLLPARAEVRALALGVLIALLVVCGVFWPIFARQVLNGILLLAIFLVLVLWTVAFAWSQSRRLAGRFGPGGSPQPAMPIGPAAESAPEPKPAEQPPAAPFVSPEVVEPPKPETGSEGGADHA